MTNERTMNQNGEKVTTEFKILLRWLELFHMAEAWLKKSDAPRALIMTILFDALDAMSLGYELFRWTPAFDWDDVMELAVKYAPEVCIEDLEH